MSPLPNTPSWCGAQLQHSDKFTFTFTLPLKWIQLRNAPGLRISSKHILGTSFVQDMQISLQNVLHVEEVRVHFICA
jgi:hypothetical protein